MTLQDAIKAAYAADDAFAACVRAHGYKSRWDVKFMPQQPLALRNAYFAKVDADKAMHDAFDAVRRGDKLAA